jgi:pSer/pThr/pTyr-binding forkhead associated (FHA) protein/uncharacterized RDD family membrane protein YckC
MPYDEKIYLVLGDRRVTLRQREQTIGRSHRCAVVIDDRSVSREHAQITRKDSLLVVRDLNSSNGTFLNGARIQGAAELRDGDELAFGEARARVLRVPATQREALPVDELTAAVEERFTDPSTRPRPIHLDQTRSQAPPAESPLDGTVGAETVSVPYAQGLTQPPAEEPAVETPAAAPESPAKESQGLAPVVELGAQTIEIRQAPQIQKTPQVGQASQISKTPPRASASDTWSATRPALESTAVEEPSASWKAPSWKAEPPTPAEGFKASRAAQSGGSKDKWHEELRGLEALEALPELPPLGEGPTASMPRASRPGRAASVSDRSVDRSHAQEAPPSSRLAAGLFDFVLIAAVSLALSFLRGGTGTAPGRWLAVWLALGLGAAMSWVGWSLAGATPGQRLVGLVVCDDGGRSPLSPRRALLRVLAMGVTIASLGVGFLLAFFHPEGRALHDLASKTRVVRR